MPPSALSSLGRLARRLVGAPARPARFLTEWPERDLMLEDCYWYHHYPFLDGHPTLRAHYDLRRWLDCFLLPEDMRGRSFLDLGTANGFFSFEMERRGAEVTSFDAAEDAALDQIPYHGAPDRRADNRAFNRRLHRGYWYAHRHFGSRARAAYGTVRALPEWLGSYDVVMLGCILQHLEDPLQAIFEADRHTRGTLILCEAFYDSPEPVLCFQATPGVPEPQYWTWWRMSPAFLVRALQVLGYDDIQVRGPFDLENIAGGYPVSSVTVRGTKRG